MKKLLSILILISFLSSCEKNSPPSCTIISPEIGSEIIAGDLVAFLVDAQDSDGQVKELKLFIDNIQIATLLDLPYNFSWETSGFELGGHVARVVAIDDDKAQTEARLVFELVAPPVDFEKPVVKLISPVEESRVKENVNIVAHVTDNIGVEYVDFMVFDEDWIVFEKINVSSSLEYSATLNTNEYPDGIIMLTIKAYDAAGNFGMVSFNVFNNNSGDAEVPIVEFLTPHNNDTVSGHIVLRARATDNVLVDHVDFYVKEGNWNFLGVDSFAIGDNEYAILWDTKSVSDGTYVVEASAYDEVANRGNEKINVIIDNSGSTAGDSSFLYDGRKYYYKTIGNQTWMNENLAYLPHIGSASGGLDEPSYYVYDYRGTSRDIARHKENYIVYGVLYNLSAAKTACPTGWHLPSDEEWKVLERNLGMRVTDSDGSGWRSFGSVGRKLKSTTRWEDHGNGDNSSGFQALPGGYRIASGDYDYLGFRADFWSSSPAGEDRAWGRSLKNDSDGVFRSGFDKNNFFSVRCIRDN